MFQHHWPTKQGHQNSCWWIHARAGGHCVLVKVKVDMGTVSGRTRVGGEGMRDRGSGVPCRGVQRGPRGHRNSEAATSTRLPARASTKVSSIRPAHLHLHSECSEIEQQASIWPGQHLNWVHHWMERTGLRVKDSWSQTRKFHRDYGSILQGKWTIVHLLQGDLASSPPHHRIQRSPPCCTCIGQGSGEVRLDWTVNVLSNWIFLADATFTCLHLFSSVLPFIRIVIRPVDLEKWTNVIYSSLWYAHETQWVP